MIQYILECIAFQLVFLIIYDLFLKRETFFQWNRVYLIASYFLSMILPWVKIEALKTNVPEVFQGYSDFLWHVNDAAMTVVASEKSTFSMPWEYVFLFGGMLVATVFFASKLLQIHRLRKTGEVRYFVDFTEIVISNSALAFSFFKSIFLGDKILAKDYQNIVAHELVHIREKHTYDLMFFELMRIVAWFNPLVYVYQNRVSELHEYIADAKVSKTHKKEQYQFLLSQVFQTQNISFINQFYKSSLIKKRIVMLQKSKSKKIWQLKYFMLVPIVMAMLYYTSLEAQEFTELTNHELAEDQQLIEQIEKELKVNLAKSESATALSKLYPQFYQYDSKYPILSKEDFFRQQILNKTIFENTNPVEFGDDVKPRKLLAPIPLPSTSGYRNYVNREKAFLILDKNLMLSIDQNTLAIRIIQKEDKNLGPGEFVKVDNLSDLTGEEIRMINRILETLDFTKKILFVSDEKNAFLVEQIHKSETLQANPIKRTKPIGGQDTVIPFATVDEVPVFPGCEDEADQRACFQTSMQKHISKNFNYPKEAQEKGIQGRVNVMFKIANDGSIQNVRMRGPDSLLEKEVARIIFRLPKMKPGVHKGKEVNVAYSIPVTFKLNGKKSNDDMSKLASEDGMEPLHIIDSKRSTKKELTALDQNDIESMHVLKGEAAQKKYGEAGKNGVIEVVTKKKD